VSGARLSAAAAAAREAAIAASVAGLPGSAGAVVASTPKNNTTVPSTVAIRLGVMTVIVNLLAPEPLLRPRLPRLWDEATAVGLQLANSR
jgi:hypothetical protein